MPNWFANNAAKSVISYTLVIAGATWAVSTFVLQDNRLNFARSELEAQKSLTEQYKSKVDLLQRDIDAVRSENAEYRMWLGQTKDAIPIIVPHITELKQQIATLKATVSSPSSSTTPPSAPLRRNGTARLGTAYIDETTGLVFTVLRTTPDRTAQVVVRFPEKEATQDATVAPGQQWRFKFKGAEHLLTIVSISFLGDYVDLQIARVP